MSPFVLGTVLGVGLAALWLLWRCQRALLRIEVMVRRPVRRAPAPVDAVPSRADPEGVLNQRLSDVQTRRFAPAWRPKTVLRAR